MIATPLSLTYVAGQVTRGFCVRANGAYIGAGALLHAGDCRGLLQHGSPLWLLIGFGIASSAGGLNEWHQMGPLQEWFAALPLTRAGETAGAEI